MTKDIAPVGVPYFRREDYQRVRTMSDDEMIATFDEFEAKVAQFLARAAAPDIRYQKVLIDPDKLLAFADRFCGGKINRQTRADCAAWTLAQQESDG